MTDVLVVGSINVDVVIRAPRLPAPGETLLGRDVVRLPGGKGANQAVALARLGVDVSLVGALGRDADGDLSLEALTVEGVDVTGVARVDASTGLALITVDDVGENTIVVVPGANAHVLAPVGLVAAAVVLQLEVPVSVVAATVRTARASGALVVLNAAPATPLPDDLLGDVDVLVVNVVEGAALTGSDDPVEAARLLRGRVRQAVVVTRGADGCLVWGDGPAQISGLPAVAVDSVGAGDAFVAALTWGLLRGAGLEQAAVVACQAGAWTVTLRGARTSPTQAELSAAGFSRRETRPGAN